MKINTKKISYIGLLLAIIGALGFSSKAVVAKLIYVQEEVNAIDVLTLRMLFAFPLYFSVEFVRSIYTKSNILPFRTILKITLIASLGYYIASYFDFLALQFITASFERIILYVQPSFLFLIGYFFFKIKISKKQIWSLVIIYLGILVTYHSSIEVSGLRETTIGVLLLMICCITFSLYVLFSEKLIHKYGVIQYTNYVMMTVSFVVLFHYLIQHKSLDTLFSHNQDTYIYTFIIAFFCTFLPSYCATYALKLIGSANFSVVGSVGPIFTIIFSIYLLNEKLTWSYMLGGIIIMIGIFYLKTKNSD